MDFPIIRGFNKTSEASDKVFIPSLFLEGCNLHCPYCMNSKLVNKKIKQEISLDYIKQYVKQENIDFIIISGGEPTIHSSLINLLEEIKYVWKCKIGLSTNGINYDVLENIIGILNHISLDIKSVSPIPCKQMGISDIESVLKSKDILTKEKQNRDSFDYEIRTTLFPLYINEKTIKQIGSFIQKDEKWILQQYRQTKHMLEDPNVKPYNDEKLKNLKFVADQYSNNVELRFV